MASSSCYGRRLSELLQEQQEPFLLVHGGGAAEACGRRGRLSVHGSVDKKSDAVGSSALGRVVRRALRWDLAGCFPCGVASESFRRLRRAGDTGHCGAVTELDDDDDGAMCGRQLSPVSVLDVLHSDEESSPMDSNWEEEEEDDKPSTSRSSQPPDQDLTGTTSPRLTLYNAGKIHATELQDKDPKAMTRTGKKSMDEEEEQMMMIMSSWERIAGDMARIPVLVELELSVSAQEWRRLGEEEEASRVGASIEAMIFEEMRGEALRDMLA